VGARVVVACLSTTGCLSAKMYVDPALPKVAKADLVQAPQPQPVQVLFEFRTKGNANARATNQLRPRVVAVAAESGLFSAVAPDANGGGVLKIVIDNVAITDNAAAKGFGTGLTFGLVGSMVTDGYVCTASYTRNGSVTEATARHAIHTTIGNHAGPPGLTPMDPQTAVNQVMDQLTWNVLKQLSDKKAFD
jgi:hypothetical protein